MFERFRERLNKVVNLSYLNFFNNINWYKVVIITYTVLYFMSIYSLLPQWFLDLILPNGLYFTNFINLFLSLNSGGSSCRVKNIHTPSSVLLPF